MNETTTPEFVPDPAPIELEQVEEETPLSAEQDDPVLEDQETSLSPKQDDPILEDEEIPLSAEQDDPVQQDEDTLTFKRTHVYTALLPLAFVLGLSIGFLFWGRDSGASGTAVAADNPSRVSASGEAAGANPAQDAARAETAGGAQAAGQGGSSETSVRRYDIPLDDDPQLGPDDAPITIVEFSDFECPFCQKFHVEVFDQLLAAYPDQIRFVYRDFPLASIHSNAISAAEAADCAFEQGAYWEFHDRLFRMEEGLGRNAYLNYARALELDIEAFSECIDSRRYQAEVQADYDYAARLGIRSTPTFFINGLPIVGAQPLEVFQQVIDRELAGEIP